MAFDREGYSEYVGELNRQKEEQESPAPAEEKPSFWALLTDPATYQKGQELANEATLESNEAAGNILSETTQAIGEAVSSIPDAYGRLMAQEQAITAAYTPDKVEEANETGDYSEQQQAVETLQEEGSQFGQSLWETAGAFTRPLRERIGAVEDDAAENGSESAQNMRDTSTFIDYFMSDEQKLSKARQIEALTGIPADATLADTQAMKSALEVYDYAKKQKAVLGDAPWSMDAVWQEYPELRNIANMSPQDAALALHQIDEVRRTHGIIDSWQTMLEYGNKELEYGNLQYKIMQGKADENDLARAAQLEEQLKSQKKTLPSVFDDPLAAIVGGVASSTPMMYQSFVEAGQDAAAWTLAASAAGAGGWLRAARRRHGGRRARWRSDRRDALRLPLPLEPRALQQRGVVRPHDGRDRRETRHARRDAPSDCRTGLRRIQGDGRRGRKSPAHGRAGEGLRHRRRHAQRGH